jgi:hypothetical protein
MSYLAEDHGGDLLRGESLGLVEVLNLDARAAIVADDLEWPRLNVLLDGWVVESPTNQTPVHASMSECPMCHSNVCPYLTSKTVLTGFIAAWFLAASPINRSSEVKETKEGVVKLPCSLATVNYTVRIAYSILALVAVPTDFNAGTLIVGHT